MAQIQIKTSKSVMPMIYAYTTPEIEKHNGWIKIGYTEQEVDKRLKQQTHTADVEFKKEWQGTAIYDDGTGDIFKDLDFHRFLIKNNVECKKNTEWFHISANDSLQKFYFFKANRGISKAEGTIIPYNLRKEQSDAVSITKKYYENNKNGEFLWNAKPRFGKTLSVYDFCKSINAEMVLIVTNRPAIANSWYSDYVKFLGDESGYKFVSNTDSLKNEKYVVTRQQFMENFIGEYKCIEFVSLQDLKGSVYFGGEFDKLKEVSELNWDVLIIDEAHEGIDTYKTDVAFERISRKFTLHLSGTPFKALANDKFETQAIFNWTYADEQKAKKEWKGFLGEKNPYENLPKLNLFTYQMSEIIKDEVEQGIEINGETEEYAFDLNEFFKVDSGGKFIHNDSVDKFLDALTIQNKFPFSTEELRNELKHTFWLLNRVESVKALARKLKNHSVFKEYEIIIAAGDGRLSEEDETKKSYDKVKEAIKKYDKTITLSVGQLTTGITIPEWTAVLMLSNMKSPALYMQAAFRSQNPCLFKGNGGKFLRKENAYVFDFDPARTLTIFEEFANDLNSETSDGRGDIDKRKENIRELLNFFPVIGEDENGEMVELNAEKVLSIPRKIRSQEVVKRGFMSDYLFSNISNIFHAPQEVIDIIKNFTPISEPKNKGNIDSSEIEKMPVDEDGNIFIDNDFVIGKSTEIFGKKVFENVPEKLKTVIKDIDLTNKKAENNNETLDKLKDIFHKETVSAIIDTTKENYGKDLKTQEQKRLEKKIEANADKLINSAYGNFSIEKNVLKKEWEEEINKQKSAEDIEKVNNKYEQKQKEIEDNFKETLSNTVDSFVKSTGEEIVKAVETGRIEEKKKTIEDSVRDHLRGFSRAIPAFIMAYGDENTTLANFDKIIPNEVFIEVTSISLEQFRFLRDGGKYTDAETGQENFFKGKLFDSVVFDDSVKEFLELKKKLANYFDEKNTEDIFDYIPPQKTNQIFTPKKVVKEMVDMLENENPECFNDPNKTFIDLYMKSGMYITEIVKRLYNSDKLKELYPQKSDRLNHIFEKQVYGLAPTEIIYRIAMSYILGFSDEIKINKHNFKQVDAVPFAKNNTLEEKLSSLYD